MNAVTDTPGPFAACTDRQLAVLLGKEKAALAAAAAQAKAIGAELARRYAVELAAKLKMLGKISGTVKVLTPDGLEVEGEVSKTVKWDSGKLMALASTMSWAQAQVLFKIEFGVAENTYKAITDEALRKSLDEARTTKYGDMAVRFFESKPEKGK